MMTVHCAREGSESITRLLLGSGVDIEAIRAEQRRRFTSPLSEDDRTVQDAD